MSRRDYYRSMSDELRLRGADWEVRPIELEAGRRFIEAHHYAGGASNTAVAVHGLFRWGQGELLGVAWWLPPTKPAAQSVSGDWRDVLALSRLVIAPEVPKNAATFVQARSIRLLPARWTTLLTYADQWRRHNGHIYRIFGWEYLGETEAKRIYTLDGRQVSVKAGPKTRTHAEMLELGAICVGKSRKHKFRFVR
jgi:hypothetical protein